MKKLVAALLAGVMVFSLAACGEKEEDFDAKGYVEGVLDATYHGDYKAHAEDVGESEEDIKKINRTLDLLDEDDDVQAVYHNWDTDER